MLPTRRAPTAGSDSIPSNGCEGYISATVTIPPDWKEFLEALRLQSTRFLLIGGHALAYHAEARLTEDLDVFVEPTAENAERVWRALREFGFSETTAAPSMFAVPNKVFMIGRKPWRIDILTGIDGVTFADAWATKIRVDFHGVEVFVIGREALLTNKRASGRKKDLLDVELLEEHRGDASDSRLPTRPG